MTGVFKAGGLWLAICMIVWLTTLWRWQSTGHQASHAEIVVQLFVLPVLLAVFLLGALWAVKRLKVKAVAPVVTPGASTVAASEPLAAPDAKASEEAAREVSAWILAQAVHLPTGDTAEGAWMALRARSTRPQPDASLQDVDGVPVMASRVAGLDVSAEVGEMGERGEMSPALSPAAQRGLALLAAPLTQLLSAISELGPAAPGLGEAGQVRMAASDVGMAAAATGAGDAPMKAHLSGVATPVAPATLRAREAMAPLLTVRVLLPTRWSQQDREAVVDSLRRQCGALLDWAEAVQAHGVVWHSEVPTSPEAFWDELDQAMVQWSRQARPQLLLVLAVDSALDEACIAHMQDLGELFTVTNQNGLMPGEGAAGLLLCNAQWPGLAERGEQLPHRPVRMWRPARTRREKSANAAGRVGTTALHAATVHAATLCLADQAQVVIVADADHRASRSAELYEALQEALPGLDPMLSVARVGEAFGELGMARALVPTALACAALHAGEPPATHALAIHLQSSHDRAVVALAPWSAPATAPA